MKSFPGVVVVLATLLAGVCPAAEWCIPSPKVVGNEAAVAALTNALTQAARHDTVTLSNGVYKLKGVVMRADAEKGDSHLLVSTQITLRGDPAEDRENVVLEGGGSEDNARIIWLAASTKATLAVFSNLNFTNAYCSAGDGGVSYYNGGSPGECGHFTNCVFRGNAAKAGATMRGAKMSDCLVENNRSLNGYGGGAYRVAAYRTTFRNNTTADGGCVNQSGAYGCLFECNTSASGAAVSNTGSPFYNCTVISNASNNGAGVFRDVSAVSNCTFIGNWSKSGGPGAVVLASNGYVRACRFIGNSCDGSGYAAAVQGWGDKGPGRLYDCTIVSNYSASGAGAVSACGMISNCTFLANKSGGGCPGAVALAPNGAVYDSRFLNNYTCGYAEGAIQGKSSSYGRVYDCIISNNVSASWCGIGANIAIWSNCTFLANSVRTDGTDGRYAGLVGGTCYNCTFRGQYNTTTAERTGDATIPVTKSPKFPAFSSAVNANLVNCDITGGVVGGSLVNCTLHDSEDISQIVSGGAALTNCIIRNNCKKTAKGAYAGCSLFCGYNSADPQLVNCTVVDNVAQIFWGNPTTVAINTIFYGNLYDNGYTKSDISCDNSNHPYLTNCLFQTMEMKPTANRADCIQLAATETPKFNKDADPAFAYYMPKRMSKAVNRGLNLGWEATGTDMAGLPRLNGDVVDIGAYECHAKPKGMSLLVR